MSAVEIDPGARVARTATLGAGVRIRFGAVIEDDVILGDGCEVGYHAVIRRGTHLGARNTVDCHAVIGGAPQDLKYDPSYHSWVEIGDDNVFREYATVSRATTPGAATRIGSGTMVMNCAHIAHDCRIGDGVILATSVALAGHVEVGEHAFLGGGAMAHQWSRIGAYAMVGGMIAVRRDVLPFMVLAGEPPLHTRANLIGLHRGNVHGARLDTVLKAVQRLSLQEPLDGLTATAELDYLRAWLSAESRRGLYACSPPKPSQTEFERG